ncbi:transposase [Romeriopsis navalis]|uniref:transposase n=1 Tax=Romeriopsis navalis TaxID=2992132 RepID=UPI0021F90D7E|nr:transposase [Romeriopsis navalis]
MLFQDECHLLWGDLCGDVWGPTGERIEVPMSNQRDRQTYYGAIDLRTHRCLIQPAARGNSDGTIAFLKYLQQQFPGKRFALLWDGAMYHRSAEIKQFLASVNQDLPPEQWKITCIRFAPNDPSQNPIEDIWLQAKRWLRESYHLCSEFHHVKWLFEFALHKQVFQFDKLNMYGDFS